MGAFPFWVFVGIDLICNYFKLYNTILEKDLFNIANQININVEKEAMKSALKAQEKMQANKRQQAETGFGVTGP